MLISHGGAPTDFHPFPKPPNFFSLKSNHFSNHLVRAVAQAIATMGAAFIAVPRATCKIELLIFSKSQNKLTQASAAANASWPNSFLSLLMLSHSFCYHTTSVAILANTSTHSDAQLVLFPATSPPTTPHNHDCKT